MWTRWGTVSAGHLLATLAAALEETSETVGTLSSAITGMERTAFGGSEDRVSGTWVASVAGDLGEVVVYQASAEPEIGNVGFWNDSVYPRVHYLSGKHWDLTDGEMIGGLDGIVMASQVRRWLGILSRTRVSQLIDMYYSSRGVVYDPIYKACNRFPNFRRLLNDTDLVAQVRGTARLLQDISNSPELIFDDGLQKLSQVAVEKYLNIAEKKSLLYETCEEDVHPQNLEILVMIGREFDSFETQRFLYDITQRLDINQYSNHLGIINGQTGDFLTNVTGETLKLHVDLLNSNNKPYPSRLSLPTGLIAANRWYMDRTDAVCGSVGPRRPFGQVVLVMARSERMADADASRAWTALRSIKRFYPETRVVYVSENDQFKDLLYENDRIVSDVDDVGRLLADVPSRIVDFYCEQNETVLEDYVTPNVTRFYEVHETYLQRADVRVKFRGNDYADLRICGSGSSSEDLKTCVDVRGNSEAEFWAKEICKRGGCSVMFTVEANNSQWKCSESDCRYPDQARLSIHTFWTRSGSMAREWSVLSGLVLLLARLL